MTFKLEDQEIQRYRNLFEKRSEGEILSHLHNDVIVQASMPMIGALLEMVIELRSEIDYRKLTVSRV